MKEFMLFIRNHNVEKAPGKHEEFLKKCERYIEDLKKEGRLKSAQPFERTGVIVSNDRNSWREGPFNEAPEIIVGYYHILANNIEEAVAIAKKNPEFEYSETARIEVRPVKMKETMTGYIYPKGN